MRFPVWFSASLAAKLVFAIFCALLLLYPALSSGDEYYNCQFLGHCTEGKPNKYIPAVECGRRC